MRVAGVDPGTEKSAWIVMDGKDVVEHGYCHNEDLLLMIEACQFPCNELGVEMVANYGMAVGKATFETVFWIGRFCQAATGKYGFHRLYRKHNDKHPAICQHICHNNKAGDKNIRQAIIDMYPRSGGGKLPQVGTKFEPGPLYGISSHVWQAMAVAITLRDSLCKPKN